MEKPLVIPYLDSKLVLGGRPQVVQHDVQIRRIFVPESLGRFSGVVADDVESAIVLE